MKILLACPPITIYKSDTSILGSVVPLGLAYIASYLEHHLPSDEDFEVKILDCCIEPNCEVLPDRTKYGMSDKEILKHLSDFKPDIVGISCAYTAYANATHNFARLTKQFNHSTFVALGGAHCSISPEIELRDPNIDFAIKGEGEITFLELAKSLHKSENDFSHIRGLAYRKNSEIRVNPPREFIKELDKLPFPARHLLPMEAYINVGLGSSYIRKRVTTMITSRGCPYQCSFCSIHSVWGYQWRPRSPKNVVDEIEHLIEKYKIGEVHFVDDNIGVDKKRLKGICTEIIQRRLDVRWATPNGIAHWLLDEELVNLMKRAGCYRITLGIESANYETRKFIGKDTRHKIELDQAKRIIKYANAAGMWTISTFILGFPYEDINSIRQTIDFAIASDVDLAVFYLAGPFPGTKLYDVAKREKLIDWDFSEVYHESKTSINYEDVAIALGSGGFRTKYFTREQLQELQSMAQKEFMINRARSFLNPVRLYHKINSLEDFNFAVRAGFSMLKPLLNSIRNKKMDSHTLKRQTAKVLVQSYKGRPQKQQKT